MTMKNKDHANIGSILFWTFIILPKSFNFEHYVAYSEIIVKSLLLGKIKNGSDAFSQIVQDNDSIVFKLVKIQRANKLKLQVPNDPELQISSF